MVVEKILEGFEHLPGDWPVHGTSGYDFANAVQGLFVDPAGEGPLTASWSELAGGDVDFEAEVRRCKRLIMRTALSSELSVLANLLGDIAESDRLTRDYTVNALREALVEVVACFPVYRTYVTADGPRDEDRRHVEWAVGVARRHSEAADRSASSRPCCSPTSPRDGRRPIAGACSTSP